MVPTVLNIRPETAPRAFRPYAVGLAAGSVEQFFKIAGSFFYVASATGTVLVSFDGGPWVPFAATQGVEADFRELGLRSVAGDTVTFWAGFGRFVNDVQTVSVVTSATVTNGDTITAFADVACGVGSTQIVAARAVSARKVYIRAATANTEELRIGESGGVGAAAGAVLAPGEGLVVETQAALFAYSASGGQTVSGFESYEAP